MNAFEYCYCSKVLLLIDIEFHKTLTVKYIQVEIFIREAIPPKMFLFSDFVQNTDYPSHPMPIWD